MVRLNPQQRGDLSETVREFAHLAAAALILSQFVAEVPRSWSLMLAGAVVWIGCMSFALALRGDR